jgi:hypothetical protein
MKMGFAGGLLVSAVALSAIGFAATGNTCNRHCLEGYVNRYLDAMQRRTR